MVTQNQELKAQSAEMEEFSTSALSAEIKFIPPCGDMHIGTDRNTHTYTASTRSEYFMHLPTRPNRRRRLNWSWYDYDISEADRRGAYFQMRNSNSSGTTFQKKMLEGGTENPYGKLVQDDFVSVHQFIPTGCDYMCVCVRMKGV